MITLSQGIMNLDNRYDVDVAPTQLPIWPPSTEPTNLPQLIIEKPILAVSAEKLKKVRTSSIKIVGARSSG